MVISGESGAGKTESAKMVLSYVVGRAAGKMTSSSADALASLMADGDAAAVRGSGDSGPDIETRLLQSSPVLEAFGNAKSKLVLVLCSALYTPLIFHSPSLQCMCCTMSSNLWFVRRRRLAALRNSNSSRFGKYIKIFFHPAEGASGRRVSRLSMTSYGKFNYTNTCLNMLQNLLLHRHAFPVKYTYISFLNYQVKME